MGGPRDLHGGQVVDLQRLPDRVVVRLVEAADPQHAAVFTTWSIRPVCAYASASAASTWSGFSTWVPVVERPRAKTRAPKLSAIRAMSAPIPYEPPNTTIVLPDSCSR